MSTIPIEHILHASSAVAFRVLDISRELPPESRLFKSNDLNNVIIFKQPSFAEKAACAGKSPAVSLKRAAAKDAIQTAIFVPKVQDEPELGGHAIFIGQPKYAELMKHHCGIDISDRETHGHDLEMLRVLANVPSFDPFLLKTSLQENNITVHDLYLDVHKDEEAEVRHVIEQRVRPIIARAHAGLGGIEAERKTQSFIESIWDPNSSDASAFIAAFRIEAEAIPEVFGAWKGISYYQYQFQRIRSRVGELLVFLQSDNSIPIDIRRMLASEREMLMMSRKDIGQKLRNAYKKTQEVFQDCNQSYEAMVSEGNPIPFRDFLQTAVEKYWTLGACNCSLALVTDVWARFSHNGRSIRYEGDVIKEMFAGMRMALSTKGVGSG